METTLSIIKITHANLLAFFYRVLKEIIGLSIQQWEEKQGKRVHINKDCCSGENLKFTAIKRVWWFFLVLGGFLSCSQKTSQFMKISIFPLDTTVSK